MDRIDYVLEQFPDARRSGDGWSACCPAHEDRNPSLSIGEGEDGRVLIKCHAGCSVEDVLRAKGMTLKDLMPEKQNGGPLYHRQAYRPPSTVYTSLDTLKTSLESHLGNCTEWHYVDADGEVIGATLRFDHATKPKTYRPVRRDSDGWRVQAMQIPRPLYRLPDLADADHVILTEGEKAADAARLLGYAATTSVGGAKAAAKTDFRPLAGKTVTILPDNDSAGTEYADEVAAILISLTPPAIVRVVNLPGLAEGGDVADIVSARSADELPALRGIIDELIAQTTAEATDVICESVGRYQPFPTELLPEPFASFVRTCANAIGCDASFIALPLLTSCGAAIGNTRRLNIKDGWEATPILWTAVIGESGTAKTPAMRLALAGIRVRENDYSKEYKEAMVDFERLSSDYEIDYAAWKKRGDGDPPQKPAEPVRSRAIIGDTTIEALVGLLADNPRGLLLAEDELSGWFGSFDRYSGGNSEASRYLSMFNASSLSIDRKTGKPKTIYIESASLCITGGIQPSILRRSLGSQHRESGLAARFLLAFPPRKPKQWTTAVVDGQLRQHVAEIVERLCELRPAAVVDGCYVPTVMFMSVEARQLFAAFVNKHGAEQMAMTGDLSAAWSKLEEYAARLALVVHYVRAVASQIAFEQEQLLESQRVDEGVIDVTSMTIGIEFCEWFKAEARRVYAMLHESDEEEESRRFVEWIQQKGGRVSVREAQQGCRWLRGPDLARRALQLLVDSGLGGWENSGRSKQFVLKQPATEPSVDAVDVDTAGNECRESPP